MQNNQAPPAPPAGVHWAPQVGVLGGQPPPQGGAPPAPPGPPGPPGPPVPPMQPQFAAPQHAYKNYVEYYGDHSTDPYHGDYTDVMMDYNVPAVGNSRHSKETLLFRATQASLQDHPMAFISLCRKDDAAANNPGTMLVTHRVAKYPLTLTGPAQPWDDRVFAISGDVTYQQVAIVPWSDNHFSRVQGETRVLTTQALNQHWAGNPLDPLVGPHADDEPNTELVYTRHCMYVPHKYTPLVIGVSLTPREAWERLHAAISADGKEQECKPLLDFVKVCVTREAAGMASRVAGLWPTMEQPPNTALFNFFRRMLKRDLPGAFGHATTGAQATAHQIGAAVGNLANEQQQQQQFSDITKAGLELMAEDYLSKKRTIVLSEATSAAKNDLMDMLDLPEKGASWPNKPILQHIDGFSWLKGDEDCIENRTAYMDYLNNLLQIPTHYALADAQPNKKLLSVELLRQMPESRKVSGTTDVAIAKSEHVHNNAVRNNIETLFELKTPKNMRKKDHTPQTIGEHFAASYLNPEHAVVSVLTDLNQQWTFFWFARRNDASKMALFKLCLSGGEATMHAKYLLDSIYGNAVGDTLPATFTNRQPFQAVLDSVVKNKRARRDIDSNDSHSPDQDSKPSPSCGADQPPTSGNDAGSSSRSGGRAQLNNQVTAGGGGGKGAPMSMASALSLFAPPADRDVANELDLLDMVDESEQYEIVRSFTSKHIVPFMTGRK